MKHEVSVRVEQAIGASSRQAGSRHEGDECAGCNLGIRSSESQIAFDLLPQRGFPAIDF
jgi:hypothetical protein